MSYRNGTYIAFDGNGTTNPCESSMKYYGLLQSWTEHKENKLLFSDSHKKTHQVKDSSSKETLKSRLLSRLSLSKNMLIIISDETNYDRGMLNFEIEKAVDSYKLPLIIAYAGYDSIENPSSMSKKWPKALLERIEKNEAECFHIPFKKEEIISALSKFSIHRDRPKGPLDF